MSITVTVFAENSNFEYLWVHSIIQTIGNFLEVSVNAGTGNKSLGKVILVDENHPELNQLIEKISNQDRVIYLITRQTTQFPVPLLQGKVDDIIFFPFYQLDLVNKIKTYEKILAWKAFLELNQTVGELIPKLQQDLNRVSKLQKERIPQRFSSIQGVQAYSRHLSGVKSGGDFFDVSESKDGSIISILLCNSSSYRLSSAVLKAVTELHENQDFAFDNQRPEVASRVNQLIKKLYISAKAEDEVSLFYGIYFKKTQILKFINLGKCLGVVQGPDSSMELIEFQGQGFRFVQLEKDPAIQERILQLTGKSRFFLMSKGFVDTLGTSQQVISYLTKKMNQEALDILNDLVFLVKSKLPTEEDFPEQDCSAIILDTPLIPKNSGRILKLTQRLTPDN